MTKTKQGGSRRVSGQWIGNTSYEHLTAAYQEQKEVTEKIRSIQSFEMSSLEIKLDNWECRQVNGDIPWIPATVPSNIHLELLKANIIPDPFIDTNEDQVQWVGEVDWVTITSPEIENKTDCRNTKRASSVLQLILGVRRKSSWHSTDLIRLPLSR